MQDRDYIKSVIKATEILDVIRNNRKPLSLEEISRLLGQNKTTCFRFLQTMLELKLIVQENGSKSYKLGPKLITLGLSALNKFDLHTEAVPLMKKLREITGETVNLSILDQFEILIIERFRSGHVYNANLTVGSRLPLHCTSQGKVILAFSTNEKQKELLAHINYEKYTDKTVENEVKLKKQMIESLKRGYSINREEFELGIAAVAGPILNHEYEPVAALNVSFPLARHPDKKYCTEIAKRVLSTCRELSLLSGNI
jgi:IclR family transcriptional regulator, KDG regulon repressor